ncbi:hypothetical protein [Sorangium atrum]|uniref:Tetracyclin repressor-like C-terminal domain-containing protein n=1 Tax=Sorangium atrum TaxID=2995308 RepID=A0ABT5C5Q3_9BACT|nr:hypothetical protein [Sorangium aterium]MDC0681740.1 hypothetical protein [Sorangium aterium]
MRDANEHSACVDAWMDRAAQGAPPDRLVQLFERAFNALWRRAHVTLGEVTLGAIVDRVLYYACERYPVLSSLRMESAGICCVALQERAGGVRRDQIEEGLRFILVEFLTVLGNLTAEILTPALHAELSKVAQEEAGGIERASESAPGISEGEDGEEVET